MIKGIEKDTQIPKKLLQFQYKEEDDPSTIPNINPINDNIENINNIIFVIILIIIYQIIYEF